MGWRKSGDSKDIDWKEQKRIAEKWQKDATETARKTGLSGNKTEKK